MRRSIPTITFKSKSIARDGDGLRVRGDLTVRGVTKEVVLDVDGPSGNKKIPGETYGSAPQPAPRSNAATMA